MYVSGYWSCLQTERLGLWSILQEYFSKWAVHSSKKSALVKSEKEDESLGQISKQIKHTAAFITYTCFSQLYENS